MYEPRSPRALQLKLYLAELAYAHNFWNLQLCGLKTKGQQKGYWRRLSGIVWLVRRMIAGSVGWYAKGC